MDTFAALAHGMCRVWLCVFADGRNAFAPIACPDSGVVLGGVFGCDHDAGAKCTAATKAVGLHLSDGVV